MPELPEVETVRRSLLPVVCGRVIGHAEVLTPGVLLGSATPPTGWRIDQISRRGKYLVFGLTSGQKTAQLIVHLRMTGRLLLQETDQQPVKHTHIRLRLDPESGQPGGSIWLIYNDPRRFGRLWLLADKSATPPAGFLNLGPEPLDPDFNANCLPEKFRNRRSSLKAVLLDQTVVAGLGNIYADEVLFDSGLHPARPASSLSSAELERLSASIVQVLNHAIDCQGTTLRDYVDGWNRKGTFQDCLMVYGRAGLPCRQCGTTIRQTRLAGRSTCWCPVCQQKGDADETP